MEGFENILYVEDNPQQRELSERLYGMSKKVFHGEVGFLTADSWEAGYKTIQGGHVSVVLLDLVLPPFGRTDTLEAVRTTSNLPPIVAITGFMDAGPRADGMTIREDCFAAGCDDFISKAEFNHRPEDLLERVYHSFLRRRYAR